MRHPSDRVLQDLATGPDTPEGRLHLEACPECRRTVSEYAALFAGLDQVPDPQPDATFCAEVMARVANAEATAGAARPWARRPVRLGVGLAAVVLVGLVGLAGALLGAAVAGTLATDLAAQLAGALEGFILVRKAISGLPTVVGTFLVLFQIVALAAVLAALARLVHDRTAGLPQEAP